MLARTLHSRSSQTFIPGVKMSSGKIASYPYSQQQAFRDYFLALYNHALPSSSEDSGALASRIEEYLKETVIPTLNGDVRDSLEIPFSNEELLEVINNIPSGKSPGPNGFT